MKKNITFLVSIIVILSLSQLVFAAPDYGPVVNPTHGGTYFIQNVGSGKFMNVYKNQTSNNTNIDIYDFDGTSGQQFQVLSVANQGNCYILKPQCAPSKVINAQTYYKSSPGININIYSLSSNIETVLNSQSWGFWKNDKRGIFIAAFDDVDNGMSNTVMYATGKTNRSNVALRSRTDEDSTNHYFERWEFRTIKY